MTSQNQAHAACRLVAVVVTHNRVAELKQTLDRLHATHPATLAHIIVCNNASTDETERWLATQKSARLTVLNNAENTGGAGGFERGMRHAVKHHNPDWIVVMDDDARPQQDALAAFCNTDRSLADIWAAAVYHPDGRICDMNRPFQNPMWDKEVLGRALRAGREGFYLDEASYTAKAVQPVDGASFVGLFIGRNAIKQAGYPDGGMFIYGDDVLYTLNARKAGATILFDPDVTFEHNFTSQAQARGRFAPLWKSYYHHRNLLMIYRSALGVFFWPSLALLLPRWGLRARSYQGERKRYLSLLGLAAYDGLRRNTLRQHQDVLKAAGN